MPALHERTHRRLEVEEVRRRDHDRVAGDFLQHGLESDEPRHAEGGGDRGGCFRRPIDDGGQRGVRHLVEDARVTAAHHAGAHDRDTDAGHVA